jgi:hypothetical protein
VISRLGMYRFGSIGAGNHDSFRDE